MHSNFHLIYMLTKNVIKVNINFCSYKREKNIKISNLEIV